MVPGIHKGTGFVMADYVLVVDDYPDVRRLVAQLLETMGIESRQAVNGATALEMIEEQEPIAIVLDLMMPVMSGFAMLTQLNIRKPNSPIPVILFSGVADDSQMKALPGVVGVLKKGAFGIEDLRGLLEKALDARKTAISHAAAKADTRPLNFRQAANGVSIRLVCPPLV